MLYLASHQQIAALDAELVSAPGRSSRLAQATLAWYLREHDPPRAERLADQARAASAPADPASARDCALAAARGTLVKAHVRHLANDQHNARALVDEAAQRFEALGDALGAGDTHLVAGLVCEAM